MYLLTNSKVCFKYGDKLYLAAKSNAGSKYFLIPPSFIVKINFPLQTGHAPSKGGLLTISLHLTHLNSCVENPLKFPRISLIKCLSIIILATSEVSVLLNF